MNTTVKLVTRNKKAEVLNKFLPQSSLETSLTTLLEWMDLRLNKVPPTVREDHAPDHLRNINIHKSMGPHKTHPRVLRE